MGVINHGTRDGRLIQQSQPMFSCYDATTARTTLPSQFDTIMTSRNSTSAT
jgi:hypothetical protein